MLHNSSELCYLGMSKAKLCVLLGCFFLSSALVGAQSSKTHPDEVSALQTIEKSLIDPKKNLANWKRGDPCTSRWTGVLCSNTTPDDGFLHVTELQLLNMNLSGSLSPALGRLPHLLTLCFIWNKINGSIPKEIGNITTLKLLLLNGNQLTGSLPDELGNLSNLDRIQIDENNISGPIPTSFAKLNEIVHLSLRNCNLHGSVPDLSGIPNLGYLLYPVYDNATNNCHSFNASEVQRIRNTFIQYKIPVDDRLGPSELKNFPLPASRALLKIDGVKSFTYGELALATNNFDFQAQIGQGGYGKVYRGTLVDSTIVAIKRAQQGSLQGEKEFLTEIQLLSRLHHRNLVSLVGYCDEEGEQMLVYEYMSNGTLQYHLSGKIKKPLSFARRLRIALGSSKGILYLHTEADPPIFHRDIKASNILLDSKFVAKVADFGLSRIAPVPDIEGATPTYVSTVVKGTPGYLDPEYFLTHKLTDKSDVYSLGVVFLELLTGMQPISHGKNLVREVNIAYQSGTIFSVLDVRMGSYPSECVEKFVNLAMKCCQDETDSRPSMAEVVRTLETIGLMIPRYSDPSLVESMEGDPETTSTTPPSSSSMVKNLYISSYVSSSDLISGATPTITPR
ncbi:hypothetical protein SLEP1_g51230 [Rubroshorea leprosula]|uniref:non-specific serine/threonine protein kinase n=1 Tax=Rubroshorea leprosula TaxID=152421 RepID=A0AAV5M2I0_9ROSI|nr:hypothetical protein SLEP1_g51230 [Rubroshorea leprosula]